MHRARFYYLITFTILISPHILFGRPKKRKPAKKGNPRQLEIQAVRAIKTGKSKELQALLERGANVTAKKN